MMQPQYDIHSTKHHGNADTLYRLPIQPKVKECRPNPVFRVLFIDDMLISARGIAMLTERFSVDLNKVMHSTLNG